MHIPVALIAAAFLTAALPLAAQEKKESVRPAVYKVEFDVRDTDGAEARPTRHYSMSVDESRKGVFQASERVPAVTGSTGSPRYIDAGVNIECTVQKSAGKAALQGEIEITDITGAVILGAMTQPIIRQRKMAFHSTVALGTPLVIGIPPARLAGTSYQVEATVTKVN